ncbi:MAG: type II secretion system protein J [Chthoniobacterales bacterium]
MISSESSQNIRRRSRGGFTIAELLIASAITIAIVVMLGTMFGSLAGTASHANQKTDTFRDARAALQMMTRDFANVVRVQPAAYFAIEADAAGRDVRKLDGVVSLKNTPAGKPPPVAGDLCSVRYYCGWNGRAYSLRRYFRDSDQTFKTLQAKLTPGGDALNYADVNDLYLAGNPIDETVASYAWNLQVVAYDKDGNIINPQKDSFDHDSTAPYICDPAGSTNALPAAIEVSFNAISPEAARALIAATSQRPDGYAVWMVVDNPKPSDTDLQLYKNLVLPNMYNFRTRIALH